MPPTARPRPGSDGLRAVCSSRMRHLRRRQGAQAVASLPRRAARTPGRRCWSTAWMSSILHEGGATASWPSTGGAPRPPGRRRRPRTARSPGETARQRRAGRAWPAARGRLGPRPARRSSGPERLEAAWDRAHAALGLFGPDGQLHDREPRHGRDRRGTGAPARSRLGEGPQFPERSAKPDLPGPDAPAVGVRRTAGRVARGDGLALVAAPPRVGAATGHGLDARRGRRIRE